jgi:hypothetical protein
MTKKQKLIISASSDEFRQLIKKITEQELKKLPKEDIQKIYDQAKVVYDNSKIKISRTERKTLYHVQEILFGALDPKITASLERIGETLVKNPKARKKAINYNLPSDGAVIVKQWKDKKIEVKIVPGGFEYKNKPYKSLSKLAKEISGYAVSGPIFFGLRKPKQAIAK